MSSFIHELNVSSLSGLTTKATVLLAVAWVLHALLQSANPRWQVCLWRSTLVGLVGLPVLGLIVPSLQIDVAVEHHVRKAAGKPPSGVPEEELAAVPAASSSRENGMRRLEGNSTEDVRATNVSVLPTVEATLGQAAFGTIDLKLVAIAAWVAVAGVLLLRLAMSSFRIRRLIRNSAPGESRLIEIAAGVIKECGVRQLPEIRTSTSVDVPFVAGLLRPVVVLPANTEQTVDASGLKLILTHEFGHVAGRDVPWAISAYIARSVLWFHPLVWRLPSAHQIACETVCDALATQDDSLRATYRSLLAKLALMVNQQDVIISSSSVAMSATAEITRRLQRLEDHISSEPLSWRRRLLATAATLVVVTTIAAATLVPRADAANTPAAMPSDANRTEIQDDADDTSWTLRLKTIDADTGEPILNPKFTVQLGEESMLYQGNREGQYSVELPSRIPRYCCIKARGLGYTPMRGFWSNSPKRLRDELPEEVTFRMTRGITVGGTVVNEKDEPVPGATVWFSAGNRVPEERVEQSFYQEEYTTDQQGQWRCFIAPREMNSATFKVNHPDYARVTTSFGIDRQIDELKALTHSWTLKEGFVIRGVVTGPNGSPVEGAHLAVGTLNSYHDDGPFAVTDADGRYELLGVCPSTQENDSQQPHQMSVTVLHKDFAPQMAVVPGTGDAKLEPLPWPERTIEFQLNEGQPLTLRVTDNEDNAVEGVWIFPSEWRDGTDGLTVLRKHGIPEYTNDHGIWQWDHAPPGEQIKYDILARGYLDVRRRTLVAGNPAKIRIALARPQILTGHVIDADTKEPIDEFVIQKGFEGMSQQDYLDGVWWTSNTQGRGGRYRRIVSMPKPSYRWKFVAKGYEPFASDSIPVTEGEFTLNVEMKKIDVQIEEPARYDRAAVIKQISAFGGTTSNKPNTYNESRPGFTVVRISFAKNKNVTDEFLTSLNCFDHLEQLDLSNTRITNAGLANLSELKGLKWLGLSGTQVTDAGLTELGKLRNLTRLEIQSSQITDAGLKTIATFDNLSELYLFNTEVTDSGMRELKKLKQLTHLSIARTPVTDEGLEVLLSLQALEMLLLSETLVTDDGVRRLRSLPKLKTLNLNATPITDAGLIHLAGLKELEIVYLHKVPGITQAGIEKLKRSRPELHVGQ